MVMPPRTCILFKPASPASLSFLFTNLLASFPNNESSKAIPIWQWHRHICGIMQPSKTAFPSQKLIMFLYECEESENLAALDSFNHINTVLCFFFLNKWMEKGKIKGTMKWIKKKESLLCFRICILLGSHKWQVGKNKSLDLCKSLSK